MFGCSATVEEVESGETALVALCRRLDPDAIPLTDAARVYDAFAHMEKLAAGAKLRLAARAEASKAWRHAGYRSGADWLARRSGTSVGAAQAELKASEQLATLPGTDDALRAGELSTGQATTIADAAAVDPAAEDRLVAKAKRASLRELREECARTRAAADPDADARYERIRRDRSLHTFTDHDGAWNLHARGPADAGARVMAALGSLIDQQFNRARADGQRESNAAYAFDALVELADDHTDGARCPESSDDSPGAAPARRARSKYLGLLHIDLEALVRGATQDEERCEITGLGPIPVRIARQLLGDAILYLVITRGRDVATVVHLGRGPSVAQKIALLWSQPTCSRADCDQPWTFAEVDHRTPWADQHETDLHNLDRLCRHDHRLKTNDGWALVDGHGKRDFVPPGHPRHPRNAAQSGSDPPGEAA
jgi:hypothetical protein